MMVQEDIETTEAETSAKESTGGSPRVPKQRKRKTSSKRAAMTVSSETIELEGEPVFKARRKDILKGKDIGNQARKGRSGARESRPSAAAGSSKALDGGESIEETLGEVFVEPLTHKTSLYKQFREEQKRLRRDASDPKYGGKGIGKGEHKRKSTTTTKKVPGSIPMEGWQDKEVVRALAGGAPPGSIWPSDSDAVVPHTVEEGSMSESSTQKVPDMKMKQEAVESAKYAASLTRRAKKSLQESIKAPRTSKIAPGMRGIKEIREQQQKYDLIIPKALFARVVREIVWMFVKGVRS